MARIVDPDDPRLADYRDLPARPPPRGRFVAEGTLVVARLLAASRFPVRSVLCTEAAFAQLAPALDAHPVTPVWIAPDATLRGIVGYRFHRGALAVAERPADADADAVIAAAHGSGRPLVVLERVTNPDNVGGVLRNAHALGAAGALLVGGCCDPLYRKALRVSMGAALEVPWATAPDGAETFARLRARGFTLLALTPDASAVDVATLEPRERLALLLGAERDGLGPVARDAADLLVRIPMAPGADSLNVATAAAIALHRIAGQPRVVQ